MNERAQKLASVAMLILSMALAACSGPTRHPVEGDSPKANAPANQPQLKEPEKPKEPAKPVWTKRGVLTTGGGLAFYGTTEGDFLALDAKTGKLLYKFRTGASITANPVTYMSDGKQQVAIASCKGVEVAKVMNWCVPRMAAVRSGWAMA